MRVPLFLTLSYLIVAVWAGGYAGCLERIWLYQAYVIDNHTDVADKTVGYKCRKWDHANHNCKNDAWEACKPRKQNGKRCEFGDLMVHLGKTDGKSDNWEVKDADNNMDVEETAKKCLSRYTDKTLYPGAHGSVFNFPGYVALKGAGREYNDYIVRLGNTVVRTAQTKKTADNQHEFDKFDALTEMILTARAGDHGKYAVPAAEKELGASNVVRNDLGPDPLSTREPPEHWYSVNWEATKLKASSDPDLSKKVSAYHSKMYDENAKDSKVRDEKTAYEHSQVVNTYKQVRAELATCI